MPRYLRFVRFIEGIRRKGPAAQGMEERVYDTAYERSGKFSCR